MNKRLPVLVLTGALACIMALPAMAADVAAAPGSVPVSTEASMPISHSVLYYGTVQKIVKDENGTVMQLCMDSDRYGEYVMNITAQTVWIDSGCHMAFDPADLQEGERIYVFHSPVETRSMPPQSAAFAVVRNVPMDAGCAQYHEVEAVSLENGQLKITTDNGGLFLFADDETKLSMYHHGTALSLEDILPGSHVMAWYDAVAESYPGQAHASYLMLLPSVGQVTEETLTRGELIMMLHEQAGKPVVNFAMDYSDVAADAVYTEAIRWATSEGLVGGYGDGTFGPEDTVSREQLVTILWRYAGSPMLMDYPGLTQFSDVDELSPFAQPAFAWAHQKGYISAAEEGRLSPKGDAAKETAESFLHAIVE